MDKKTAIDILNNLLAELGLKPAQLASAIGVNSQALYNIQDPKKKNVISNNLTDKIVRVFPQINRYYLLTGKGNINNLDDIGEYPTRAELMREMKRVITISENISEALVKSSEAALIRAQNEAAYVKMSDTNSDTLSQYGKAFDKIVNYIVEKDKL